jgi:hypothetical protein
VWTADGGTFAETNDAMDNLSETTGGSFSPSTMQALAARLSLSAPANACTDWQGYVSLAGGV